MFVDDHALLLGELTEDAVAQRGCQAEIELIGGCPRKVLVEELLVVELEVISHVLQSRLIVGQHQVGVATDDVNLLHLLAVVFRKLSVVLLAVAALVVELNTLEGHALVRNHKAAFERQNTRAVQEQKRVFNVAQRDGRLGKPALLAVVAQQLYGGKRERDVVGRGGAHSVCGH